MIGTISQVQLPAAEVTVPISLVNQWTCFTFLNESSATVVVGTNAALAPVGSGKGMSLPTNIQIQSLFGPGTQLYAAAANGSNGRISWTEQPVPIAELMLLLQTANLSLAALLEKLGGVIPGVDDGWANESLVKMPGVPRPGSGRPLQTPLAVGGTDPRRRGR